MKNLNFIFLLSILGFSNCSDYSNPNELDSDNYKTIEKRVEVLKGEIKSFSDFDNAEFELFNVNGFSNNNRVTVPGASSWDYKFAIKTNPSNVDKWVKGMTKIESNNVNVQWMNKIIQKRKNDWITDTDPEFYTRKENNVIMVVYRSEGIIFKRVITN